MCTERSRRWIAAGLAGLITLLLLVYTLHDHAGHEEDGSCPLGQAVSQKAVPVVGDEPLHTETEPPGASVSVRGERPLPSAPSPFEARGPPLRSGSPTV